MAALAAIKPAGVVEGATTQSQNVREPLQIQADCRATPAAEVHGDALVAGIGAMIIPLGGGTAENHILSFEDRFDEKGSTREALTERAMTDRNAHRCRQGFVADVTTQAATFVST